MPVNPMQRRMKNSFLLGFLLALIIMALVVAFLIFKMKAIEDEKAQLVDLQKTVYVAGSDLKSGESVTIDSFVLEAVQSSVNKAEIISDDDFSFVDEEGNVEIKLNKDGSEKQKEVIMKVDVPKGTIVTKDMIADATEDIQDDVRIQEYNMIILPSELETGDYVDIRYSVPQGQDYIVLAKKKVLKSTATGIWLKLTEDEILTMNNAIVDNYRTTGSMLRAIELPEPAIQEALEITYPVNSGVLELINANPNIVQEAKTELFNRYNANNQAIWNQRPAIIDPAIMLEGGNTTGKVEEGNQEEISKIQQAREEYISSLGQ